MAGNCTTLPFCAFLLALAQAAAGAESMSFVRAPAIGSAVWQVRWHTLALMQLNIVEAHLGLAGLLTAANRRFKLKSLSSVCYLRPGCFWILLKEWSSLNLV